MKITHKFAQNIVEKTMDILGKNINIMDENGFKNKGISGR